MQQRNATTQERWTAWDYRDQSWSAREITGYEIEATDGSIGSVHEASQETGGSYLIVDTGPWIFGKKVMLPAGVVSRVDHENRHVFVDRTKDQIKNAPEYDESRRSDMTYREELGGYYGEGGRGWHDDSHESGARY
jgi:hypothetical protein